MIRYYGPEPPEAFGNLRVGGICPHCGTAARFIEMATLNMSRLYGERLQTFVNSYACDACSNPIAIQWHVDRWSSSTSPIVSRGEIIMRLREPFDFSHVPESVRKEIGEALDCLSVNSYNGFAALSRRAVQAICTDLGAGTTAKVKSQIEQMLTLVELDKEWKDLALQIMLSGHDGSHPHLPDVDEARARVLLSLLRDLVYQLYTRPGNVKAAATLRKAAVESARG